MRILVLERLDFEALMQVVNCPDFEQIPKILETPYIPDAENKKKVTHRISLKSR